jgi:predicted DNA-binding protein with PD1-like motif
MVQGQIRHLDPAGRLAVIALDDGREVTATFPTEANIEVLEPATMGTMGGTLEDLQVGYWVGVELHEHGNAACSCSSLVCIS